MLHAYCIRRAEDASPPADLAGIDGAAIGLILSGDLGLWVSEIADHAASIDRLRDHERVVRRALRSATPIPFRYGQHVEDREEARRLLRERASEFVATFDRLDNRVEMGLRVTVEGSKLDPRITGASLLRRGTGRAVGPGKAYLETRREALAETAAARSAVNALLDQVEETFAGMELVTLRTLPAGPELAGTLAHLLRRVDLRLYKERAAQLQSARPDLRISLTGPWAPYSFV